VFFGPMARLRDETGVCKLIYRILTGLLGILIRDGGYYGAGGSPHVYRGGVVQLGLYCHHMQRLCDTPGVRIASKMLVPLELISSPSWARI
jgi:hypothetical protein